MNMKKTLGLVAIIILIFAGAAVIYRLIQTDVSPANIQTLDSAKNTNRVITDTTDLNDLATMPDSNSTETSHDMDTTDPSRDITDIAFGNQVGDISFDFTLQDHEGNEVTLSDLNGKKVVLNFWMFGCPACYNEFPDYQRLHDRIDTEGIEDIEIIKIYVGPIGYAPSLDEMRQMLDDNGYSFTTYWDTGEVAIDYGIFYIPHTFVIDEEGIITASAVGPVSYDSLIELLDLEDHG